LRAKCKSTGYTKCNNAKAPLQHREDKSLKNVKEKPELVQKKKKQTRGALEKTDEEEAHRKKKR